MSADSRRVDMTSGSLVKNILRFALPVMLSGLLQLTFNAADVIVVGRCAGDTALAAVTSSSSLINMLLNIFVGLSLGSNVLIARSLGEQNHDRVVRGVHTSIALGLICGVGIGSVGLIFSPWILRLMGTPDTVMGEAVLYLRIYFLGVPASVLYNFGSSVLRASGDTRRPMRFLMTAGALNVVLNLWFVLGFGWGVAGVAVATTISNLLSCSLVIRCLIRENAPLQLDLHRLMLDRFVLVNVVKIGVPASLQGVLISMSNVVIQTAVNSFGDVVMAGSGASANIEGFVWTAMNAFYQACLSFTGRNLGAGKLRRVDHTALHCMWLAAAAGLLSGGLACLFGPELLGLYTDSAAAVEYGMNRMLLVCLPYFILGMADVLMGSMRGMGMSLPPMINAITFMVGFRILWINTVLRVWHTQTMLYINYPISWIMIFAAHWPCWFYVRRKVHRRQAGTLTEQGVG